MTLKKLFVAALTALAAFNSYGNDQADNPKREFRGAWIHTIFQSQYSRQSTNENQQYLRGLLDKLQDAGCNAIIFQVRPQADALYPSGVLYILIICIMQKICTVLCIIRSSFYA